MRKLLIVLLVILCISCTVPKYIDKPVYIDKVRTEYINQVYKDSIYIHDSIDRYMSNDTVYLNKYKYVYQAIEKTDTIVKTDSILIPVEVKTVEIKEVSKLTWYQKVLMWLGGISSLFLLFKIREVINRRR